MVALSCCACANIHDHDRQGLCTAISETRIPSVLLESLLRGSLPEGYCSSSIAPKMVAQRPTSESSPPASPVERMDGAGVISVDAYS